MIIGSHVSMSGKDMLLGSVKEALSYGANTFMFYTGAPQNTKRKAISELLWIYQAQTNDVSWLRERENDIWDKWAVDSDGIYRVYEADTENYDGDKEVNVRDVDGNIIIGMKAKSLIEGKNIKEARMEK